MTLVVYYSFAQPPGFSNGSPHVDYAGLEPNALCPGSSYTLQENYPALASAARLYYVVYLDCYESFRV
jgi:hypothetical protein